MEESNIETSLSLPKDYNFRDYIISEIRERFEGFPDAKRLKINLNK